MVQLNLGVLYFLFMDYFSISKDLREYMTAMVRLKSAIDYFTLHHPGSPEYSAVVRFIAYIVIIIIYLLNLRQHEGWKAENLLGSFSPETSHY